MFRDAQKGITAKQFDELGNEVSFDVREDEEMVRIAHEQVIYTTCTALSNLFNFAFLSMVQSFGYFLKKCAGCFVRTTTHPVRPVACTFTPVQTPAATMP